MAEVTHEPDDLTGTVFGRLLPRLKDQERLIAVGRVEKLGSRDFQEKYAARSFPIVIRGMVEDRLMRQDEVIELLRMVVGAGTSVRARYGAYADPLNYVGGRRERTLALDDFLHQFRNGNGNREYLYLANYELDKAAVSSLQLTRPDYYPPTHLRSPRLWLGPAGAITPLHKDGSDNFSVHLFGRKRWVLFPVRDYPYLYMNQPDAKGLPGFACSRVDVRRPDYDQFPLYRHAKPLEVEIDAGEVLYLPAGWSHYVETLHPALMVNYWVDNRRRLPACLEIVSPPRANI